jgi:hypothetical protein
LTQLFPVIAGAAMTIAAVWSAGRAVAPRLGPSVSFGAGAVLVSSGVFALMLFHRASLPALVALLLIAIAAGPARSQGITISRPPLLTGVICAPFLIWYVVNALAPEVQADANVYHLLPAMESLRYTGFSKAISFYDRLPHALELLYVPAWRIGGGSAAKLVHFAFLLASTALIVRIAALLELPRMAGPIAAAVYFCTPIVAVAGTCAFNDAALVYFSLAAVLLAIEDEPIYAGLMAGFCYSVKMTGLIAVPVALAFFLWRRQWRFAAICGGVAFATLSPWLIRNAVQTGNPFAPFLNSWFPNPYFYVITEHILSANLRDYGVSFGQRFPELLTGSRLQGIIGPAFVLAPLALLGARRRNVLLLIALATVFSLPWWMNAGARFLMPAIPFVALAICSAVPFRGAVAILILHAITAWPAILSMYSPEVLQLRDFPLRAALRLETEEQYLNRTSLDYRYAKMTKEHTPADARIFDLTGVHCVYANREFVGFWNSALGARLLEALEFARAKGAPLLAASVAQFEAKQVCGVRIVRTADTVRPWSLNSVDLMSGGKRIEERSGWQVRASTNVWETPLAFDKNLVSRWSTRKAVDRGIFVQVDIANPIVADSVRVLWPAEDQASAMRIDVCANGAWQTVPARTMVGPELNLRPGAVEMLRKAGITHILASASYEGIGILGDRMVNEAGDWGLEVVTNLEAVYLLRLR